MSKVILRDDDAIEILDFLFKLSYNEDGDYDNDTSCRADYLFDKLSVMSGRDSQTYFKDLILMDKMKK
jgi:hypothetical protein